MGKKIGFFGGTFDPPHIGHESMAIEHKEHAKLDMVLVCPTSASPLKQGDVIASNEQRLDMVRASFGAIPGFHVIEKEIFETGPSYTVETMQWLAAAHPGDELYLLLGADHIPLLPQWRDIETLLRLAQPLIGMRGERASEIPQQLSNVLKKRIEEGMKTIPLLDISATKIRKRLAAGAYCGHLLKKEVLDLIHYYSIYLPS